MTSRARRLRAPLAVGLGALMASAYVGLVDPNTPGHYPLCPTKAFTGLDCPGCGGLRAVHSLMHGDIAGALDHNAFVVLVVLPAAIVLWARWLWRTWKGTDGDGGRAPADVALPSPVLVWSVVALAVAFTVARNVAGVPALAWLGATSS
jgi:hypothetical protein